MSKVIARLREEHLNIAKLLKVLTHQLSIFDTSGQPDYDVLVALADYFVGFPDRCHHPKEDLVYRKMCERNVTLARTMADLEAEHETISALARNFQEAVNNLLQEAEVPRNAFHELAQRFVSEQRRHMEMEEERLFPLALQILTPDDWVKIDDQTSREEDPVFGGEVAQEFAALRDDILKWGEEDETLGP